MVLRDKADSGSAGPTKIQDLAVTLKLVPNGDSSITNGKASESSGGASLSQGHGEAKRGTVTYPKVNYDELLKTEGMDFECRKYPCR